MLPFRTELEASSELDEAAVWYEGRRDGLGLEFLQAIDNVAVHGLEAVITTKVIQSGGNVAGFDERKEAQEELKSGREGFSTLNNLRNALAHGVRSPDPRAERALKNEANLRNTLKSLLTQLLDLQRKEGA